MTKQIIDLVEQEIATMVSNIDKHQGIGCYVDVCQKWHIQLASYVKVREMIMALSRKSGNKILASIDKS